MSARLALSVACYTASIALANVMTARLGLQPVGFGLMVTAGTFAAGFALLARDFVQRYGGVRFALFAVVAGGFLSWFLASPGLALASTIAFAGAEVVDLFVYTPLRRREGFALAALVSNIVSAPLDTVLFLWLAGFSLTADAVVGQFIGKVVFATVIPLALYVLVRRALLREPIHPTGA